MPIIFDPRIGASLIGHLIGGMTGAAITRKSSFLLDSLGKRIFPEGITIIDDPVRPRGLRSRPFDGEGLPTRRSALIDKGVLTGRSEEHTPELQSLLRLSYANFCLKTKTQ